MIESAAAPTRTGGIRQAIRKGSLLADLVILAGIIGVADAGLISEADGVVACVLAAAVRPSLLPYLLLVVAGFQDARGLSYDWWYAGTLLLGGPLVVSNLSALVTFLRRARSDFKMLLVLVVSTTVYGVVSSYIQDTFWLHEQASSREPIVVGLLALAMTVIGISVWERISVDEDAESRVRAVFWLLLVNGLAVSIGRMFLGYDAFSSGYGAIQMDEAAGQLETAAALGFPRLTGTYLTPIGFAVCIIYVALFWEVTRRNRTVQSSFVVLLLITGCALSLMSLAKSVVMFVFFVLLGFAAVSIRAVIPSILIVVAMIGGGLYQSGFGAVLSAFRFASGTSEESYRAIAWSAIASNFTWKDWLFGTGIGYWPRFLERYTGFRLSDPHTYLLSVPGTYGVLGVLTYMMLAAFLIVAVRRTSGFVRAVAVALIGMFFVVDAVSIPYVIGNTPITMQIWGLLAALGGAAGATQGRRTARVGRD